MFAGAIDIYNHYWTGSVGLEDSWHTQSSKLRQFAGFIGFIETNTFLAMRYFYQDNKAKSMAHSSFRKTIANAILNNQYDVMLKPPLILRSGLLSKKMTEQVTVLSHHLVVVKSRRRDCYYIYCANVEEERKALQTVWMCDECDKPLCSQSTTRECFQLHIAFGSPAKKYRKK